MDLVPQNAAERTLGSATATLEIQSNEDLTNGEDWSRCIPTLHIYVRVDCAQSPHDNGDSENASEGHS